jgi:hypothetical protein
MPNTHQGYLEYPSGVSALPPWSFAATACLCDTEISGRCLQEMFDADYACHQYAANAATSAIRAPQAGAGPP